MSLRPEVPDGTNHNLKDLPALLLHNGRMTLSSLKELKDFVTKPQVLQWGVRLAGIGLLAAASYIPLSGRENAQAESLAKNPTTLSCRIAIQAFQQRQIEFNIGSDHYRWSYENAAWNINPPNTVDIPTGTVWVEKNNVFVGTKSFQPLQSLYAPYVNKSYGGIFTGLAVGGMAVDAALDRYYLGTATVRPLSNTWDLHLESGTGIATAENYTGRQRIDKGLPTGGFSGAVTEYITVGRDERGNWLNMMISGCDDMIAVSDTGTYQTRLDNNGGFAGDTFIKLSDSITAGLPYRLNIPLFRLGF